MKDRENWFILNCNWYNQVHVAGTSNIKGYVFLWLSSLGLTNGKSFKFWAAKELDTGFIRQPLPSTKS